MTNVWEPGAAHGGTAPTFTVYKSNGTYTYTAPAGATAIYVECYGAGGGGNGADSNAAAATIGQTGGSGAYSGARVSNPAGAYTVVVGAAGAGGLAGNNAGGVGGDTSVTNAASVTVCLAKGGSGGSQRITGAAAQTGPAAAGGSGSASTGDITITGPTSGSSIIFTATVAETSLRVSAAGPLFTASSPGTSQGSGPNGVGVGCGGCGGVSLNGGAAVAGGHGSDGLVYITEYY